MAYSTAADVRIYAPQAPATADAALASHVEAADARIDGVLRGVFAVPLQKDGVDLDDNLIKSISAKIAAGEYLKAMYSAHSRDAGEYPDQLIGEAVAMLGKIAASPGMIDADLYVDTSTDDPSAVVIANEDAVPRFHGDNELDWG